MILNDTYAYERENAGQDKLYIYINNLDKQVYEKV